MSRIRIISLSFVTVSVACTFAPVNSEGQKVRVAQAKEVTQCQKIGYANAKTADRVVIFARTDRSIREEVESLARNEAAQMGGDAIVPIGEIVDGRQAFDVYRCAKS